MLLANVVETSRRVSSTTKRLEKIAVLASMLQQLAAEEVEIAAAVLSGNTRQRRIGIGRAVMMAGDIARVARSLLESGVFGLDQYDVQLFRPVHPMLAQTAEDAAAAIHDLGQASLEFKFDGARVQVHRSGDEVLVFSRSLKNVTSAAPEVVEAVRAMPGKDLILDGEVL